MKEKAPKALRLLLGLFMTIIGTNKFLEFIDIPSPAGDGGELIHIYLTSGFLSMIGILQILGGVALLVNHFVPLALTIITAIMFNATVFHLLHDPHGGGGAMLCLLLSLVLVFAHRDRFSGLLAA